MEQPTYSAPQSVSVGGPSRAWDRIGRWRDRYSSSHLHTVLLFTWTDYKTIFFPITSFASATAPVHSLSKLVQGCIWTWLHLILCNVSNQVRAKDEDAINRPWRPLPSGRITVRQALAFRWMMVALCITWSATYGLDMVGATFGLVATTLFYDEAGLANHPFGKNLCNVGGYTAFEVGATKIMGVEDQLDYTSMAAIVLSGMLIFTTIQAQDFPDVEGDAASNRVTFPIYAPEFSRAFTLFAIPSWSLILCWFWNIGWLARLAHILLGIYVGARYYFYRTPDADKRSYIVFNLWLMFSHLLPLHARTGLLSF